jgi:hypothetical protein
MRRHIIDRHHFPEPRKNNPLTLVMTQRFAPCSHASRGVVGMRELLDHQRRRGD